MHADDDDDDDDNDGSDDIRTHTHTHIHTVTHKLSNAFKFNKYNSIKSSSNEINHSNCVEEMNVFRVCVSL